jgi:transcriptional regulator with XRE-family HTH domain
MSYWLDRLKEMKKKSGKTTEEIARAADVPFGTVNKILFGQTANPQLETVRKIVTAMGYTLNDLTPEATSDEREVYEYLEVLRTRPELKMLFKVSKNVTREEIEQVVRMIEAFKDN